MQVPLKYARLVTNAVPTIFRVERTRKNVKNVDREGKNNAVPEPNSDTEILENNNICKNETGSILIVQSLENPVMQDVSQSAPCPQSKSSFPKIDWKAAIVSDPFVELLEHSSIIQLPENWFTATASTKKCIAFYDLHWKDEQEALYPAMRKSLTIGDNMEAHYSVNRGRINPLEFSFPDRFESLDIVNETLQRFASMNICCGIGMYDDVNLVREKIGYTDNANQLRHKRCSIITVKQQCDACKQVRKVIYQKKIRMKKREQVENGRRPKRGNSTIKNGKTSLEHVTLLDSWRRKIRSQHCALQRAKRRIQTLKSIMQTQQEEVNKLQKQNVRLLKKSRPNIKALEKLE